jgi:hypothetical protein
MDKPSFVNIDGSTTEDGRRLIDWIESQFVEADRNNDVALINSLSGEIKHYYVNVYKLNKMTGGDSNGLTPGKWLSDYRNSIAMNAWRNFQYTEEQAVRESQLDQTTAKTEELAKGLNDLQESLAEQFKKLAEDNATLRAELDKLRKGKKAKVEDADEDAEV